MRILFIFAALMLIFTGCSNTNEAELIKVETHQAEDVPFEGETGRTTIVYEQKSLFDINVLVKGLNPEESYEIFLLRDGSGGGLVFGPEANIDIRFGNMVGETLFKPNHQGELFVSMLNPDRVALGADELRVEVRTEDGKKVMRTSPFVLVEK